MYNTEKLIVVEIAAKSHSLSEEAARIKGDYPKPENPRLSLFFLENEGEENKTLTTITLKSLKGEGKEDRKMGLDLILNLGITSKYCITMNFQRTTHER